MTDGARGAAGGEEPPPFGKSWGALYAGVLAALALVVAALAAVTAAF